MKLKKSKIILPVVAVCVAIAVLLTVRLSLSYLTDTDVKDNIITLGNVSIKLDEGEDYIDDTVIAAGGALPKAPTIANTGNSDEYVFIRIAVPVRNVTLLYEESTNVNGTTYKKGQPLNGTAQASEYEIFRTVADGHPAGTGEVSKVSDDKSPGITIPQIDIAYNKGDKSRNQEGWVYIDREQNKTIDATNDLYDFYYFGYNRRLKYQNDSTMTNYYWMATNTENNLTTTYYMTQTEYNAAFPSNDTGNFPTAIPDALNDKSKWSKVDQTIPLFDRIQLKSFIDQELATTNNNTITDVDQYFEIKAYAIQADDLGTPTLNSLGDGVISDDTVKEIFGIVKRKAG